MAARPIAGLALCAGAGGLELGLRLALGGAYRTVGYVERDVYRAAVLVARMAAQALDPAPVWDDLESFDGRPWRGRVDLVSAGFPCQPFSAASKGRGLDDDRWLWPHIARVLDGVRPAIVFCENVPPLARRGLAHVLRDLADLGFDAQWARPSAAAVGASHCRDRLWFMAYRHGSRLPRLWWQPGKVEHDADGPGGAPLAHAGSEGLEPQPTGGRRGEGPDAPRAPDPDHQLAGPGEGMADPEGDGGRPRPHQGAPGRVAGWIGVAQPSDSSRDMADTPSPRRQGPVHGSPPRRPGPARPGDGLPLWPPGPDDHDGWAAVLATEGPQPSVLRVADGLAARVDRLHTIATASYLSWQHTHSSALRTAPTC